MDVGPSYQDTLKYTFETHKQHMANQRFTGTISLTSLGLSPEMVRSTASMLVGQGGANIRRMTGEVPGSHIRLFKGILGHHEKCGVRECDSVLISARTQDGVRLIATMIKKDIQSLMDPCKNSSRPTITLDCLKEAVGSVIGKGGAKLKDIQGSAGGNCFIRHDQGLGKFVVSADDEDSVCEAKLQIEKAIQKFHDTKHWWGGQSDNSDSDGDMEDARPGLKETEAERVQRELLSAMFKSSPVTNGMSERDRWSIRESLGNKLSADGSPVYKTYWGKAHQGVSTQCSGTHAVPWSEVDNEIERRRQETMALNEKLIKKDREMGNEKDRQRWEDSWETPTDTESNSSWDAIESHSDNLQTLKSASGSKELQEHQAKVDDEKTHARAMVIVRSKVRKPQVKASNPVDLCDMMSGSKPGGGSNKVDLGDLMASL